MNRKFILGLLTTILISHSAAVLAYNSDDLNKRLRSCTPTKDFNAGGVVYQISGLTGSTCIFKIENYSSNNKPNLICKVPYSKMYQMTSLNPLTVQRAKNNYCVMSMKAPERPKRVYY